MSATSSTTSGPSPVVCVTGGARGLGRSIVQGFAARGARVVLCDRDEAGARATADAAQAAGHEVWPLVMDLTHAEAPSRVMHAIAERYGRLDVLVNNARSGGRADLTQETPETWDRTMSVTLRAAFFLAQAAIAVMRGHGGGAMVNISSVASAWAGHESPSYHSAKAALSQLTRYLALHAGPDGVRVNAVVPGFIIQDEHLDRYAAASNQRYREMAERCHPLRRTGRAHDVVEAVRFLASTHAEFITGQCLVVDGGLTIQDQSSLVFQWADIRHGQRGD